MREYLFRNVILRKGERNETTIFFGIRNHQQKNYKFEIKPKNLFTFRTNMASPPPSGGATAPAPRDGRINLFHAHIIDSFTVFVPQLGYLVRIGGKLRIRNGYNNAHVSGSPIFAGRAVPFIDCPNGGVPETAVDCLDEWEESREGERKTPHYYGSYSPSAGLQRLVETVNEGTRFGLSKAAAAKAESGVPFVTVTDPAMLKTRAERYLAEMAARVREAGLAPSNSSGSNAELTLSVTRLPFKSSLPRYIAPRVGPNEVRAYGIIGGFPSNNPQSEPAYEMINNRDQPAMRLGCQLYIHRARALLLGGLQQGDYDASRRNVIPYVYDFSTNGWQRFTSSLHNPGCSLYRAAATQASRHSAVDELVCFSWGGRRVRGVRGLTESEEEKALQDEESRHLYIGWFFPDIDPRRGAFYFEKLDDYMDDSVTEEERPAWELGGHLASAALPLASYETQAARDQDGPRGGAFLHVSNRLPPPSHEQFCQMRDSDDPFTSRGGAYDRDAVWETLFLFKSNGEVWQMSLTARGLFERRLRWVRMTAHFALPRAAEMTPELKADKVFSRVLETLPRDGAKTYSSLRTEDGAIDASVNTKAFRDSLTIIAVLPRSVFSRRLVPQMLYPDVYHEHKERKLHPDANESPVENRKAPHNSLAPLHREPPPSNHPEREHAMQADTEFVIVCAVGTQMTPARTVCTTFIPALGHSVADFVRIRLPEKAIPYGAAAVTPHFIRPRPPMTIIAPPSDSRFVYDTNVDKSGLGIAPSAPVTAAPDSAWRVRVLPRPRAFSALVSAVMNDGDQPQHGEAVATYVTRAPMSLLQIAAQSAVRVFPTPEALHSALEERRRKLRHQLASAGSEDAPEQEGFGLDDDSDDDNAEGNDNDNDNNDVLCIQTDL